MPIGLIILLLLIGLPLVEITVFIQVGSEIGALWTILLTVATAIAGSLMLRIQGLTLLTRMRGEMDRGEVPGADLVEGALMVVASILLLIPGFVTDAFGLLLFVPPVRRIIAGQVIRNARVTVVRAEAQRRGGGAGVVDLDADDWETKDGGAGRRGPSSGGSSPWISDGRNPDGRNPGGNREPD
ncbi:MAG: FxsA protein [Stappia sp.]|jgi:UPF0716 protein FxsA|uniref:FxsA family protein n=1 Tax=Stappia sp. TaxID=1870903 RepID=UPI000C4375E1|nr:FxsA family protein [Stappia sp.]MAB00520.1 FxsA protein [Stappia sp.]MBM18471.1 FxsA protein [Stappia sp.]